MPTLASAAGLGRLSVQSALGQPLKAEIEVVSVQPGEADSLIARLAPSEAFRQANIELNGVLYALKFTLERRPNGQHVVVVNSTQPINEPFVDMLVELNWASGRLVREYTFLLDPPEYRAPTQTAAAQPVSPPAAQPLPAAPAAAPAPSAETAPSAPPAQAKAPQAASAKTDRYEVKRGDTLAKIAQQHRIEGVTFQQMLVALFKANQDAFIGENMNRMRAGKILNLPEREAAVAVSNEDARRLVASQSADFAEYRRGLGQAVAATPARADAGRQASGQIGAPAEEKPVAAKEPTKDQLRLSSNDDAKRGGKAAGTATADDLAAKEKALKESGERVAALEKNVQDLQKLLELKSSAGAQVQQQAQAAKAAPADAVKATVPATDAGKASPPAPAATAPTAESSAAKAAPADAPAKAADVPNAPDAASLATDAAKAEPGKAPADGAKAPEAAKAAPLPGDAAKAAPPAPEPSLVDELLSNEYALAVSSGVIVMLGFYAAYAWRKKRQHAFADSILGASPSDANSVFGTSGGRNIDTGSSSFQSDFSQSGIGKIDTEEIDPIAEADVYMAYGRDAQAEEILKDALAKDSSRQGIRGKLLEIYANRKDLKGFETAAAELYAATNGQGPEWEKAVSLGMAIDPENALYGGRKADGNTRPEAFALPMAGAPMFDPPTASSPIALDMEVTATQPGSGLDFDLELGSDDTPAQPDIALDLPSPEQDAHATAAGLDFDLGLGGDTPSDGKMDFMSQDTFEAGKSAHTELAPALDGGLNIDFDLPMGDAPAAAANTPASRESFESAVGGLDFDLGLPGLSQAESSKAPDLDLSGISLDLGAPDGGNGAGEPDARWQEVATKLDLAKAYEEMGDKDGARDLLKEVVQEGDAKQQQQARSMLDTLG